MKIDQKRNKSMDMHSTINKTNNSMTPNNN